MIKISILFCFILLTACGDSTADEFLGQTKPKTTISLTDVFVSGICPLTQDDRAYRSDSVQMSMVLMSRTDQATILPDHFVYGNDTDTLSALQQPSSFNFQAPQNLDNIVANGFVQGEDDISVKKPISLSDPIVSFFNID